MEKKLEYGIVMKNGKYYNKFGSEIKNLEAYLNACKKNGEEEEFDYKKYNITKKDGKYYNSKNELIKNIEKYINACKNNRKGDKTDYGYNDFNTYDDNFDDYSYKKPTRFIYNEDGDVLYRNDIDDEEFMDLVEEGYFDEDDLRD